MAAQIEGPTSIPAWRAALDKLQERHPLLSVAIEINDLGCGFQNGDDQLRDERYDVLGRGVVRGVDPFFDSAVNRPTCGSGNHLGWSARNRAGFGKTDHQHLANCRGDCRLNQWFKDAVAYAVPAISMRLGQIVAGRQDKPSRR
jgi:hypothetical protein